MTIKRALPYPISIVMMTYFLLFLATLLSIVDSAANAVDRPEFKLVQSRVKEHRAGPTGELVEGEEHLLKVILGWEKIPNAEGYEICHNCNNIDDDTGNEINADRVGTIIPIGIGRKYECGLNPCLVLPGAPAGYNRFNLRVQIGKDWSPWSTYRNFYVIEPGNMVHEEL